MPPRTIRRTPESVLSPITPEVRKLLRSHQTEAPVAVSKIAEAFGVKAYESSRLPNGISGKLFYDPVNGGSAQYSILVNQNESRVRKRFTIAHEVAHFILHRANVDEMGGLSDDTFYRSGLPTLAEAEANRLAAEILMPSHLIARFVAEGILDIEALAERFDVSYQAMLIRIEQERPDLVPVCIE